MPEHSILTPEKELQEQEQRAVAVSTGGAATAHNGRNIRLIIGREYKNRVTQRSFIISSIVIMALVVIAAFVPTIIQLIASNSNSQTKVVVVVNTTVPVAGLSNDALAQSIGATLNGTANSTGGTNTTGQNTSKKPPFAISVQTAGSLASLKNQVKNGSLNVLLTIDRDANSNLRFTYYTNSGTVNDSNLSQIQSVAQQLNFLDTAHRLGLTPAQTSSLFVQPSFDVVNTGQSQSRPVSEIVTGYILAYAGNILIYMAITLYGMGVATGVAEEKGSRIMEILVNAATPFQLMVGKIVGIGAAGLTQMVAIVVVGIGALLLQNPLQTALFGAGNGLLNVNITSVSITFLLLLLLYFLLGFLLYATLYAALGALVKRQDEVQNAVAPLTFLLVFGYIVSFFGVYTPDATWMKVISYIPFWTPTTMLVRLGVSQVAWWEIAMTVGLMLLAIVICAWISARIYRFGVLMYGQRPGLGQLARLVRAK
jgi:ABC-2 type transport system permease protein